MCAVFVRSGLPVSPGGWLPGSVSSLSCPSSQCSVAGSWPCAQHVFLLLTPPCLHRLICLPFAEGLSVSWSLYFVLYLAYTLGFSCKRNRVISELVSFISLYTLVSVHDSGCYSLGQSRTPPWVNTSFFTHSSALPRPLPRFRCYKFCHYEHGSAWIPIQRLL